MDPTVFRSGTKEMTPQVQLPKKKESQKVPGIPLSILGRMNSLGTSR